MDDFKKGYKAILNGQNFLIDVQGEARRRDFYATRILEASSSYEAERLAMQMILSDEKLRQTIRNTSSNPPKIFVDEISEVVTLTEDKEVNSSYIFYLED